jgi:hypothetical protein
MKMRTPATEQLLDEIEQFLDETLMRASTFGHKTVADGKLVERLRKGRTVTLDTASAIRQFMTEQRRERRALQKKAAA